MTLRCRALIDAILAIALEEDPEILIQRAER